MPAVDLIEETFVAAAPTLVAAVVREPGFPAALWPDLTLAVYADRGAEGLRWTVAGPLVGTAEVWLEPHGDGVIAHTFLRAEGGGRDEVRRRARHAKRFWWDLKDRLEAGRRPGEPAVAP